MESEVSTKRPDSPKKKLKPSSSTHSDMILPDCSASNSQNRNSGIHSELNGLAPNRKGRAVVSSSNREYSDDCQSLSSEACSIQEEVVSSSENIVTALEESANSTEGDADSASKENESEIVSSNGLESNKVDAST